MVKIHDLVDSAKLAAQEAGQAIMRVYVQNDFDVEMKADQTPLTIADKKAHAVIAGRLQGTGYPILSEEGLHIEFTTRRSWEYFWLIDPLDGTKEFIGRNGEFTVNIAFIHNNKPIAGVIYAPVLDTLYAGGYGLGVQKIAAGYSTAITPPGKRASIDELKQKEKINIAVSRSHLSLETEKFISQFPNASMVSKGSSLKFMMLLEGKADLYPRFGSTMEWDTAAGHAILNAAGRGVYTIDLRNELVYNKPELVNPWFIAF